MMKNVNAEIISVGSELLLGQIANTNAQWLSKRLADLGINVFFHHTVGDNFNRLEDVMKLADKRSDLVIVTGGLGPTDDDLTREVAAVVLDKTITTDEEVLRKVEQYFTKNNLRMSENNRKQAHVFSGAKVFYNTEGMAPGMFTSHGQTGWVFLPGVPREMKSLMSTQVLPFLTAHYQLNQKIISKVLKFIGIGESLLEDELSDIIRAQTNPTVAPLAGEGEVTLRLTAKATTEAIGLEMINEVESKILERVGAYCYGADEDSIEYKVFELLREKNMTLSSAESLTGGRFIERIISIPGASSIIPGSIVCYQEESKINVLQIPRKLIQDYGTISKQCASQMATNVLDIMKSTIGISFTGNAGPNAAENKPVGTVFIGIKRDAEEPIIHEYQFKGNRDTIRNRSVKKGFELLYNYLKN
jgi:nicotinamide-nucleotide amidase